MTAELNQGLVRSCAGYRAWWSKSEGLRLKGYYFLYIAVRVFFG